MKKIIVTGITLVSLSLLTIVSARSAKGQSSNRTFNLPSQAKELNPGVFDLGTSFDKGEKVQGLAILHPKPAVGLNHKPNHKPGGGDTIACYTFIANGARWRETEGFYIDPVNQDGYPEASVVSDISAGMSTWESQIAFNIFGTNLGAADVDGMDTVSTDGKNEIMFGDISEPGTIGVTVVWYTVGGPPWSRRIVEHDMMFEDPDYTWGNAGPTTETVLGDPNIMDFLNIATHELGHSAGMGDVYDASCSQETEYGYGQRGETKKRTLNTEDITGIKLLYK